MDTYSKIIRALRYGLPLLTFGGLAAVVLSIAPAAKVDPLSYGATAGAVPTGKMTNARFLGVDDAQQPFRLEAKSAQQHITTGDVTLDALSASLVLKSGERAKLQAGQAYYDHQARKVYLIGSVELADGRGHALKIRDLAVDITGKKAMTTGTVAGQTPQGSISAEGLEILEAGKRLVFTGASSMQVTNAPASDTPTLPKVPVIRLQ